MIKVFVSYRREDSSHQSGRLYDHLVHRFGKGHVFKDVDSIPLGLDFREVLTQRVGDCDIFLAVIGDEWLTVTGQSGTRRLDDPGDFVRIEIEAALGRRIPVIPVLVGKSSVPQSDQLPPSLQALSFRNGLPVRPDPDFHTDVERLIRGIETVMSITQESPAAPTPETPISSVPAPEQEPPAARAEHAPVTRRREAPAPEQERPAARAEHAPVTRRREAPAPEQERPAERAEHAPVTRRREAPAPEQERPAERAEHAPVTRRREAPAPEQEPPAARTPQRPIPAAPAPGQEPPAARTPWRPIPAVRLSGQQLKSPVVLTPLAGIPVVSATDRHVGMLNIILGVTALVLLPLGLYLALGTPLHSPDRPEWPGESAAIAFSILTGLVLAVVQVVAGFKLSKTGRPARKFAIRHAMANLGTILFFYFLGIAFVPKNDAGSYSGPFIVVMFSCGYPLAVWLVLTLSGGRPSFVGPAEARSPN